MWINRVLSVGLAACLLLVSLSVVCEMCVPERAKRSCVYVACGALPDWLCLTSSM